MAIKMSLFLTKKLLPVLLGKLYCKLQTLTSFKLKIYLSYFKGSVLDPDSLRRCNISAAKAVVLLNNENLGGNESGYTVDGKNILAYRTIKDLTFSIVDMGNRL